MALGEMLRRAVGVSAAGVFTCAAVVAATDAPGDRSVSAPAAPPSVSVPTGSTPAPTRKSTGVKSFGILLTAEVNSTGGIEVVERIRLRSAVDRLALAAPRAPRGVLAGLRPRITGLQAKAGSGVIAVPRAGSRVLRLPTPSVTITLRYQLIGATVRSEPAPPGRVLAMLAPISGGAFPNLPVVTEMVGKGVRNLVCPDLPSTRSNCGVRAEQRWVAGPVPATSATAVAQVDLPVPGSR